MQARGGLALLGDVQLTTALVGFLSLSPELEPGCDPWSRRLALSAEAGPGSSRPARTACSDYSAFTLTN